jgi:hypothetical protein
MYTKLLLLAAVRMELAAMSFLAFAFAAAGALPLQEAWLRFAALYRPLR